VSIDIRLNSIGTALSWWSVARPHLGTSDAVGRSTPTILDENLGSDLSENQQYAVS
jgi:hypothetical protein